MATTSTSIVTPNSPVIDKLSMSLDSIIESEKKTRRGGRGGRGRRGGGGGSRRRISELNPTDLSGPKNPLSRDEDDSSLATGPIRRGRTSRRGRPLPYQRPTNPRRERMEDEEDWKHDMYTTIPDSSKGQRLEAGCAVLVSNLENEVNADDVKEIFSQIGTVKSAVVNYAQTGRSLGTAEVTFGTQQEAEKAAEEYDGAEVDGRPMYLKLTSTIVSTPKQAPESKRGPSSASSANTGGSNNSGGGSTRPPRRVVQNQRNKSSKDSMFGTMLSQSNGYARSYSGPRTGGSGGRGRGLRQRMRGNRGRRTGGRNSGGMGGPRRSRKLPSQDQLNAELDAYHQMDAEPGPSGSAFSGGISGQSGNSGSIATASAPAGLPSAPSTSTVSSS